ncbi:hypothetical protein [Natrarchaeobius oligotrophus]|uniref:hypothetical protein n=1 Tax=Natrarchaeobius oligotrophus TaxID=3455743 RepID=UPI001FB4F15C|nr:hypothetical protein [Natrarchaeobius chitinivorans]
MTSELQLDYDVDPGQQIDRLAEITHERYPSANVRTVEEVLVADGGPVEYLGWIAFEDYRDHCFFYHDENPDRETLRWLLSISPQRSDMPALKRVLKRSYDEYGETDHGTIIEIPDTYLPGSTPKAYVGFYHNPITDDVTSGILTEPLERRDEILEDVAKLVPARDLETFVLNVARTYRTELREQADRHVLEGDISSLLEDDSHTGWRRSANFPRRFIPDTRGLRQNSGRNRSLASTSSLAPRDSSRSGDHRSTTTSPSSRLLGRI